jgi:paraquat-inducible protein B
MSDPPRDPEFVEALPKARVRRRRWAFAVVWVVPVVAAIVTGYLVYGRLQELGPMITIRFHDGGGVKAGQTEVRYRGVPVGQVEEVELTDDHEYVLVKARLRRSAASIAREGSVFWIVRPEVAFGAVRGLSTVITGPYLQAFPGTGPPKTDFKGLERAPPTLGRSGIKIALAAAQLGSIRPGTPVYYRGIEVGSVVAIDLNRDATAAHATAFIEQRYARLIRSGSRFWNVSGVDVNVSLFRGVQISLESLRSLVTGGIAFATPEDPNAIPVKEGTIFPLHDKPEKEWLEWRPKIPIPPASNS